MQYLRIALLILLVSGCSPGAAIDAIPDAEALAEQFFDDFKLGSFGKTVDLYDDQFWEDMPKDIWTKALPNLHNKLGPIESCELANWSQSTSATTSGSGNFVFLVYQCRHTKYESTIRFTVLKPLSGGESKILSQNISSIGLLLE